MDEEEVHTLRHGGDVCQEDSVEGLCYGNVVSSSQGLIAQLAKRESGRATNALLHLSCMHHLLVQYTKQQKMLNLYLTAHTVNPRAQCVIDCTHRQRTSQLESMCVCLNFAADTDCHTTCCN